MTRYQRQRLLQIEAFTNGKCQCCFTHKESHRMDKVYCAACSAVRNERERRRKGVTKRATCGKCGGKGHYAPTCYMKE